MTQLAGEVRRYDMTRRSQGAALTRAAIVHATHDLLSNEESSALTLEEVARAAGVSRATIYKRIGSRRDLLAAVFEDTGRRIQYERVSAASSLDDPATALLTTIYEVARAWSLCPVAVRRTLALAVVDPEVGELVAMYEGYRRQELAALARRLGEAGQLGNDISVQDAAAIIATLTSFPLFDLLRADAGDDIATRRLLRMAISSLGLHQQPSSIS